MTAVSDAITAHDALTTQLMADLDAVHVTLTNLMAEKKVIEALGSDNDRQVEAGVAVSVAHYVPSFHGKITEIRKNILSLNFGRSAADVSDLEAHDWEAEFNAQTTISRE